MLNQKDDGIAGFILTMLAAGLFTFLLITIYIIAGDKPC